MIDDLTFTWILYALNTIFAVVGALILTTRPNPPLSKRCRQRHQEPPAPREPTTPNPGVPEKVRR